MALPPPFYPLEAERKGATPQQVISTVSIIKHFTKEYRKSLNSFFFAVWICLWNLQSDGLLDRPHLWELWNKNGPSQFVQVKLLQISYCQGLPNRFDPLLLLQVGSVCTSHLRHLFWVSQICQPLANIPGVLLPAQSSVGNSRRGQLELRTVHPDEAIPLKSGSDHGLDRDLFRSWLHGW